MHAPANPFAHQPSAARTVERAAFGLFRACTYLILFCATAIFGLIFFRGAQTVFTAAPPFVNWTFLTAAPETLYVFEHEGKRYELGDKDFRQFKQQRGLGDLPTESYAHSAGGIGPCIVGTFQLVVGSMAIALFVGICSAIYLNEYSKQGPVVNAIRLAILNLAGVPSIVFGLFGMGLFVHFMPMLETFANPAFPSLPVGFGRYLVFHGWGVCLLSGWFTLALMALPVVIAASEESLKAVPMGFREGSLALGATKWQSISSNVLPYALPGMLTSSILGIARVAGETAPIMFTAAYVMRDQQTGGGLFGWLFEGVMALPYHIYVVSSKIPQNQYTERVQYGTAFIFLLLVTVIALTSILLRIKMRSRYRW
ncbi:MAG: phosphate transport system permease protein [Chthoniobacter sp.]|jgi:phosphate transport system permease protein|nr:phosphate transport system permease protein [Chthoniobacter sp.]